MVLLPCGDETGVYYVVVSGLPWSATWQTLKDFVRYPTTGGTINVDHVYIYPSTTDGWVRVHGKEDFERAYGEIDRHLDMFEGKAIAADDRNGTDIVNLRDMAPIINTGSVQHQSSNPPVETYARPSTGYSSYSSPSTGYNQQSNTDSSIVYQRTANSYQSPSKYSERQSDHYSPVSTTYSDGDHSQSSTNYASSCSSFGMQSFDYSTAPQSVYLGSPPATPVYAPMQVGYFVPTYSVVPTTPVMQPQYQYPVADTQTQPPVQTEARKIIITHLPHSVTEKEIQTLLERAVNKSKSRSDYPIELIEIPRYTDGKARGHAFATFFSSDMAQRAVDTLHGETFQHRTLSVRFTKEGVRSAGHHDSAREQPRHQASMTELVTQIDHMSVDTGSSSTGTVVEAKRERREKTRPRAQEKSCDDDSEREREKSSGRKSSHSTHSTSAPAVANGSGSGGNRRHR